MLGEGLSSGSRGRDGGGAGFPASSTARLSPSLPRTNHATFCNNLPVQHLVPKPASLPAPVSAGACRHREHEKSGFEPDFAAEPGRNPLSERRHRRRGIGLRLRLRFPAGPRLPARTHLAARMGPHADHGRMQMARKHGLMGPDTGFAVLKIALPCRSRVIARAFRAEGPENCPQGTANGPGWPGYWNRPRQGASRHGS